MKLRNTERLAILALIASTASCTQTPGTLGIKAPLDQQTSAASLTPLENRALINISVRWPLRRQTQAIPDNTTKIVISVYKNETKLDTKELVRGANAIDTASFDLDPTLKTVTIKANALDANGGILSTGESTVILRNNTISQVSILLSAMGLSLETSAAYALLNNPILFKNRFSNLTDATGSILEMKTAVENLSSSMNDLNEDPFQATGSVINKAIFNGYAGNVTFDASSSTHKASVYLVPDSTRTPAPDSTTATASLEVHSTEWATLSYPIVTLIGGQLPATGSVDAIKASLRVFANGLSTNQANASLTIDSFRPASLARFCDFLRTVQDDEGPLYGMKQVFLGEVTPPPIFGPFLAKSPTHFALNLTSDPLDAALDLKVMPETLTGTLQGTVTPLDNTGAKKAIEVFASLASDGSLSLKLTDTASHLQAIGTVLMAFNQPPEIHAKFYDTVTGQYLAKLDYKPTFFGGTVDMTRLTNWPTLVLNDGNNTEVPMTPGYFHGERDASGSLNIGVK